MLPALTPCRKRPGRQRRLRLTGSAPGRYDTFMRRCLCLLLLPNPLLTPALCLGHAAEHRPGSAPHFHTHQLPLGFPHDEDTHEDDHDHDAIPVADLAAALCEQPLTPEFSVASVPLADISPPVVETTSEASVAV